LTALACTVMVSIPPAEETHFGGCIGGLT